ncbi:TPA: VRR-NUC domain-containing protein [Burkholderia vietnamiensis]|nr:VRR-NUC domain-containing protein [Burkholderia vietnamiensis]
MLEKTVETYLVDRVRAAGGDAYKFTSPQRRSVPDRIVAFPPGRLYFVELKRPGNKPTKAQLREHERLRALGCDVRVIDSREAVDTFVREASAPPAPYLYVYEYPSPFGGTHREFSPTTWNGQQPARAVALYVAPQQPAGDKSRADALTPCIHADDPKACYRVRCQLGGKCADDDMSPRQPAAAPIDDAEEMRDAAMRTVQAMGLIYTPGSDRWRPNSNHAPAPSPADERAAFEKLAAKIHYPGCWDTAAYPTLAEALVECAAWYDVRCGECADGSRARAASASQPADERAAFEKWWLDGSYGFRKCDIFESNDVTEDNALEIFQEGWQAHASSANETGEKGADALAHEVWAAAQLVPGEGIEDGVQRIAAILSRSPAMAAEAAAIPAGYALVPVKITDEMIEAAMESHYGKRRVRQHGGAAGIAMTVNEHDWNGIDAMRRFWKGALAAAPQPAQADARVGLTGEQRSTLESLARTSTPYEQEVLRGILTGQAGGAA